MTFVGDDIICSMGFRKRPREINCAFKQKWQLNLVVKFCCTLICMLVIIFFSRLRRLWLPTGISGRKHGQFGFLKLQGQYIYNHRNGNIYPLDIRCGSQNGWHHFCPLYLILGFEENSLALSCLPEGWKGPKKRSKWGFANHNQSGESAICIF